MEISGHRRLGEIGRLAIGINHRTIRLDSSWGGQGFLGVDIFSADLGVAFRIVNIYGPCQHREPFWNRLLNLSLMTASHTILGGDLNFSLGFRESWGSMAQVDSITYFMRNALEQADFVDVPMHQPMPTWCNRRVGEAALAHRLDRFLLKGPLIQELHHFKQWVGSGGLSDHSPIHLEILGPLAKPKAPFKFNHTWLQDQDFIKLVSDFWQTYPINREASLARGFCKNLTKLKHIVINWAKEKNKRDLVQLISVEEELSSMLDDRNLGFRSAGDKTRLIALENQRASLLKQQEESLRLHSRAIWLKAGDENSKFFHNFAKGRKVSNTIWSLPHPEGGMADNFNKLSQLGTAHFRGLFRNPPGANLVEIIEVASHFPRFVNEEDSEELMNPVTMEELESTLKWFKKDKSPGPDGWTIEFYLDFFEQIGQDLLSVIEECRISGSLYHAINSTFIALIPKTDSPSSFDDFCPISLCNVLYKIISKIIANRLRPILSTHNAPHQFAFLEDRQIHEAIGSAQEALHSIWTKHLKSTLLKIDLSKAFDRVSWLYIKMILIHLGFPISFINWIMACISTPTFSILINGSASHFFHSERGPRQGCPLSPLLFLLVMEGLSSLIISTTRDGTLRGLKISEECFLTHLLFLDDVLILLDGSMRDTMTFSHILALFSQATGMQVNRAKSTITMTRTSVNEAQHALQAFPFSIHPIDRGLKYLGFWLKPTCQRIADWTWLIAKLEKRLTCWSYRYISRAGRLILIKTVLEATPVFWMALAWIPRHTLAWLQQICNRYLWAGSQDKRIFAWIGWQKIAIPKKWGGWGLKDLPLFAQALAAKMSWALITSQNLWTRLSYHKYIWPLDTMDWIRLPAWNSTGASSFWKAIIYSMPMIRDNLAWRIRDGAQARIGIDPWAGSGGRHQLPCELVEYLLTHDIKWHQAWESYREALTESHIRITEGRDELIWSPSDAGYYTPKDGYTLLISHKKPESLMDWWQNIWKLSTPPRSKLFFWCILRNKVPTGDNLQRRAHHGPTWCVLCKTASESTDHLFLHCSAGIDLWTNIKNTIAYNGFWAGQNIMEAWTEWSTRHKGTKTISLPAIVIWHLWKTRNLIVFQDKPVYWHLLEARIIAAFNELPDPPPAHVRRPHPPPFIDRSTPWAFFDGAANQQSCGGGIIIHKSDQHHYRIKAGLGTGSNNYAELITLRHLLHFALGHNITCINIFGDSKIIIDWFNNNAICHIHTLNIILHEIQEFKSAFNNISCSHIYREHNESADRLSKEAALMDRGVWEVTEVHG
eukprot:PITA_12292